MKVKLALCELGFDPVCEPDVDVNVERILASYSDGGAEGLLVDVVIEFSSSGIPDFEEMTSAAFNSRRSIVLKTCDGDTVNRWMISDLERMPPRLTLQIEGNKASSFDLKRIICGGPG